MIWTIEDSTAIGRHVAQPERKAVEISSFAPLENAAEQLLAGNRKLARECLERRFVNRVFAFAFVGTKRLFSTARARNHNHKCL